MGTNKLGELTRVKNGRVVVTHQPFPRPLARGLEKIRLELKAAAENPQRELPLTQATPPSAKTLARKRNKRSVARAAFGIKP